MNKLKLYRTAFEELKKLINLYGTAIKPSEESIELLLSKFRTIISNTLENGK